MSNDLDDFMWACRHGDLRRIDLILSKPEFDPDERGVRSLMNGFQSACYYGVVPAVKKLMNERKVNINCRNANNTTGLHLASRRGHSNVVRLLLTHPLIETDIRNCNRESPFFVAITNNNVEIARLLLLKDPNIDMTISNDYNENVLMMRCKFKAFKFVLENVTAEKAYDLLTSKNNGGMTVLDTVVFNSDDEDAHLRIKYFLFKFTSVTLQLGLKPLEALLNLDPDCERHELIIQYVKDPEVVWSWQSDFLDPVSGIFTQIVMLSDNYFVLNTELEQC